MESNPLQDKYGRIFETDDVIFDQDEVGELMFIIQEGQVQISRTISGRDVPIALLEKGEFFGEMALVNRIRRTARARAMSRTLLLAFDRNGLEQLVEKNPKIALSIIDRLCRRLGTTNAQVQQMALTTNRHALKVALQVMAQREGQLGTLQHLQLELGMTLQCPQQEVADVVTSLVNDGILITQEDSIRIGDRDRFLSWVASN